MQLLLLLLACENGALRSAGVPARDTAPSGDSADTGAPDGDSSTDSAADTGIDTAGDTGTGSDTAADTSPETGTPDTAPPPRDLEIAVISDLNDSYGSTTYGSEVHAAVASLVADPPDLVLVTGDMVAGQQRGLDYAAMWAGFHAAVTDPLTRAGIPVAVTPGNHDASAYSGFEGERAEFGRQWTARAPAVTMVDDTNYPFRYAFLVGDVLFVSLDDTTVGTMASSQRAWVDSVLATPAAHRVVFGHVPLHAFTQGRETEILGDSALEAVFVDRGVDVFVSGHHHAYYPGRHGELRVVAMGCLGSGARRLIGDSSTSARSLLRFHVGPSGIDTLEAYGGSRFTSAIARSSLPSSVGSGAGRVVRDDL
jgi:hypothetical protein